jgi:hypothetical protein
LVLAEHGRQANQSDQAKSDGGQRCPDSSLATHNGLQPSASTESYWITAHLGDAYVEGGWGITPIQVILEARSDE